MLRTFIGQQTLWTPPEIEQVKGGSNWLEIQVLLLIMAWGFDHCKKGALVVWKSP